MEDTSVNFMVSKNLLEKIDATMEAWGFATRSEFFRFCAVRFLTSPEAGAVASDNALREYSKSINTIKASKRLAQRHNPLEN